MEVTGEYKIRHMSGWGPQGDIKKGFLEEAGQEQNLEADHSAFFQVQ